MAGHRIQAASDEHGSSDERGEDGRQIRRHDGCGATAASAACATVGLECAVQRQPETLRITDTLLSVLVQTAFEVACR